MARLYYRGKLSPVLKVMVIANNLMAWINGNSRNKAAIRNRIQHGYEGTFSDDVAKYDDLASDHYRDLAENLIDGIDCKNKIVLDIGCGTGLLAQRAFEKGAAKVVCVDFSQHMLDQCRKKFKTLGYPPEKILFKQADADNLPFENNTFDLVVSGMVFGLVVDQEKMLAEMYRVTRSGGRIALSTHGPGWYYEIVQTMLECMLRNFFFTMRGSSTGIECWFLTQEILRRMLEKSGFTTIGTKQDKGSISFTNGGDVWDFFAACSSAWFLELFKNEERDHAAQTLRNYFLKKNITRVTYDAVMGYGRKI